MAIDNNGAPVMTMPVMPTMGGMGGMGGFGGFGGDGWWIILILLFAMGNGGWGNNNGSNDLLLLSALNGTRGGAMEGYTQVNDFSSLERENDIIRGQICDGFANTNQILANGFQGIQTSFANAELSRSNTQAALMGQMYTMSMADLQRGCDIQSGLSNGFASTNYNLAQQGCDIRNTIQNTTRDAIDAGNANTRAILDTLNAQRLEAKDEKIADLQNQLNAARLAASQSAQNNYLVDQLRTPTPIPAYQVANPYAGCGCNSCGCGNYM